MRGYMYQIVEMFPIEGGNGIRELHSYDNLADAEKVMEVLESVNVNFTCYSILLYPVWENEKDHISARQARRDEWEKNRLCDAAFTPCDHNGSSASMTSDGHYSFHCPKCGVKYGA
jgi:hypothetical protein